MTNLKIKRGDTFALNVRLKDEAGQPLILPITNLKSQIRDSKDLLICELTISEGVEPGLYSLIAPSTSDWAVGTNYVMDIQMDVGGQIKSSDTLKIYVDRDVTR